MARYFIALAYKGTQYAGFQVQDNANSIQAEVQKALQILFKTDFELTGSSRTDAGVHALQNYFHFDTEILIAEKVIYNLNAILPNDIAVHSIKEVAPTAHCRFDAVSRFYNYHLYTTKNPFIAETAYFYPYHLDIDALHEAASLFKNYTDFTSFSKRNTQAFTNNCTLLESEWIVTPNGLTYKVRGNRFLRGMVRGLVGTMLHVGKGKISIAQLKDIIEAKDCSLAFFDVPAHGLFLMEVEFKKND
jgi:tRNA pseudouridine38-40 synthase